MDVNDYDNVVERFELHCYNENKYIGTASMMKMIVTYESLQTLQNLHTSSRHIDDRLSLRNIILILKPINSKNSQINVRLPVPRWFCLPPFVRTCSFLRPFRKRATSIKKKKKSLKKTLIWKEKKLIPKYQRCTRYGCGARQQYSIRNIYTRITRLRWERSCEKVDSQKVDNITPVVSFFLLFFRRKI